MQESAEKTLVEFLSLEALKNRAGSLASKRGEDYFYLDKVSNFTVFETGLSATVHGEADYRVEFLVEQNNVMHSCSCPIGVDGSFCKHCVALGLYWLHSTERLPSGSEVYQKKKDRIYKILGQFCSEDLVSILLDHATYHDSLFKKLEVIVDAHELPSTDIEGFKKLIDRTIKDEDVHSAEQEAEHSRRINVLITTLEKKFKKKSVPECLSVIEYFIFALDRVERERLYADSGTNWHLGELSRIHLELCDLIKPDNREVAKTIFDWELNLELDCFTDLAKKYQTVLGEEGMTEFRKLVETLLEKLTSPQATRSMENGLAISNLLRMKICLARIKGDVDEIVGVLKKDLSKSSQYLEIAKALKEYRRNDEALEWAEKGIQAFPKTPDAELVKFIVAEYEQRNRHTDILNVLLNYFKARPTLEKYKELKTKAEQQGTWTEYREKILTIVREERSKSGDCTLLVEILLSEENYEAAWQEARKGNFWSDTTWLRVLEQRAKTNPEDAIPEYQKLITQTLEVSDKHNYEKAIELLHTLKAIMKKANKERKFQNYLELVRSGNKHRPKLTKMLKEAGLWL